MDEYGCDNGVAGNYLTRFNGTDMIYYEDSVSEAIEQRNSSDGGNLMLYFDEKRNPAVKAKVLSAVPSVEVLCRELVDCTTVILKEPLTNEEMKDLQSYLEEQFSDGWGESFEQQEIQTGDGVLYVHFAEESLDFEVEQVQSAEQEKKEFASKRPKMKLVEQDGNIFAILGRAYRLLQRNGQTKMAKEMYNRVCQAKNYPEVLYIISEYVETELSEKTLPKQKKRSDRER